MDYGDPDPDMARMRQRANDATMQILQESTPAQLVRWIREFDLEGPEEEDARIIEEIAAPRANSSCHRSEIQIAVGA